MDDEQGKNSPSCYTQTHFPTGVVQGSERLPVITTAIDQSDQRKLEVDWLDASVKSGDTSPPLSHSFPFLLLPSPLVLFSLFIPQVLFFSFYLPLLSNNSYGISSSFSLQTAPHPKFPLLWLLFHFMSMWSYCSFIVREMHLFLLSRHTHKHTVTLTKAPGEVISLGLQLSEQQASVGGWVGVWRI